MTTSNLSPKNPVVLGVLALAAFWLLTQRKASAATLPGNTNNAASKAFFVSPATASLKQQGQGTAQAQANLINTAITSLANVFAPNRTAVGTFGTSYYPGHLGQGTSAEIDGSAGEAAARDFYVNNQDLFAVNPPTLYQQQIWADNAQREQSTGGWLDSQ